MCSSMTSRQRVGHIEAAEDADRHYSHCTWACPLLLKKGEERPLR